MLVADRPSSAPLSKPTGPNKGPINGLMADTTIGEHSHHQSQLGPEAEQEQQKQQKHHPNTTNQHLHSHNYTDRMSDQIPLMVLPYPPAHSSSLASLERDRPHYDSPTLINAEPEDKHDSMEMKAHAHLGAHLQRLCELHFNYSALYSTNSDTTSNNNSSSSSSSSSSSGSGSVTSGSADTTSASNPSVSSHSLPLSRQEASSSASEADASVDLTSAIGEYQSIALSTRDGHRNRSAAESSGVAKEENQEGIGIFEYVEDDHDRERGQRTPNHTTQLDSGVLESQGGSSTPKEMDLLTLLTTTTNTSDRSRSEDGNDMNNIPGARPTAFGSKTDNSESSPTSVEVEPPSSSSPSSSTPPPPTSYWGKTPSVLQAVLDADADRSRLPLIGWERFFHYLLGPTEPTTVDGGDYVGESDFEKVFGVSEEHMKWLCTKWRGSNNITTGAAAERDSSGSGSGSDGSSKDGIKSGETGDDNGPGRSRST